MKIYIVTVESETRWQRAFSSAAKARKWMKAFLKLHNFTLIAESKHGDYHSWVTGFKIDEDRLPTFHAYYSMKAMHVDADGLSF